MPKFGLTLRGAESVKDSLKRLRKRTPVIVEEQARAAVQLLKTGLSYSGSKPPLRPNQTYVRTYNMMNKYSVGKTNNGFFFKASAPYSAYVLGDALGNRQARIHVGRWKPLARTLFESIVKKLPTAVIKALKIEAPEMVSEE